MIFSLLTSVNVIAADLTTKSQKEVEARRVELRDSILQHIHGAVMPTTRVNINDFGAKGDGKTDCCKAFAKAIKQAKKTGGAYIVVPEGTYFMNGPLTLDNNICIELQQNATLKFTDDYTKYPVVSTSWEGTFVYNHSPFIYGKRLKNVAIIGEGTIDGNAQNTFGTWRDKQKEAQTLSRKMNHDEVPVEQRVFGNGSWLRPQLMQLYECEGITLNSVMVKNSPFWCIHLLKSKDIICRGIRYDAKLKNNDGIDPEYSKDILIEGVHFDNADDNIAIKCGRDNDGWNTNMPCENIVIRQCHFKGLHAVVVGSEMSAGVRNIIVENCDFAGYVKRGVYLKTNPNRGGFIRNVFVKDCTFGNVEDLFYVTNRYAGEGLTNVHHSVVENLFVDGLKCDTVMQSALVLQGTELIPVRNVMLTNVNVKQAETGMSFEYVKNITLGECVIGKRAGTPSKASANDKLF